MCPIVNERYRVSFTIVTGDIVDQPVDAIVNPWNRNIIPRWLHFAHGTSKAIKKAAGPTPFRELHRFGLMPVGGAVLTSAGRLPYRGIIHVAGLNMAWRATTESIQLSVRNTLLIAAREKYRTLALPVIGSGSGGYNEDRAVELIEQVTVATGADLDIRLVRFVG
jgi:O-acetyl-ADP-ribose deacetylase (regulator of RNase III)